MSFITYRKIFNQLKADLIGKDSHRGITLTYAWLANQFGHMALGFIPAFLLYHFLDDESKLKIPLYVGLLITSFWFLFELYNFLGPLIFKKTSISNAVYIPKKEKYIFSPNWKNIAFDTLTDISFFAFGAFTFALIKDNDNKVIIAVLIVLSMYLTLASKHWFLTKMYQFYANYPFQVRLSEWDFNIRKVDKEKIINFINSDDKGKHLLVFGSQLSGKTSLGVSTLNELSIRHKVCSYISAVKLYTYFSIEENISEFKNKRKLWSWKQTDYLLIDDINPGSPILEEIISPEKFLSFLDPTKKGLKNTENHKLIAQKNIVWILGNCNDIDLKNNHWSKMLQKIGVDKKQISIVNLE